MQQLLSKGLQATASLWPPLREAYALIHQAEQILTNPQQDTGAQVRARYLAHVRQMQEQKADLGPLGEAIDHFCHLTDNFSAGLFQCYDVEGLPRTNNDLEHCFGVARVHERRATGRRGAIPGVVVRGSVRVDRCGGHQTTGRLGRRPATQRLSTVARVACPLAAAGGMPSATVSLSQRSGDLSGHLGSSTSHVKIAIQPFFYNSKLDLNWTFSSHGKDVHRVI